MSEKIRAFFAPQNLTEGPILKGLVRFSIPLILGNFAQQLYSMVDSIIVGQVVPGGLAAIGATFPIINFSILFFAAIAAGSGVMVAQYYGAEKRDMLSKTISNTFVLTLAATLVLDAILIPLVKPLLNLISTPPDIFQMAATYLQITFIGFIGSAFFNISSGILRGLGDSFSPLVYLLVSTVTNIVLDILFIRYFHWGIAGAAWATISSQALSAFLCTRKVVLSPLIDRLRKEDFRTDFQLLRQLIKLGIPSGITQGLFSIAMIFVQKLVNQMGSFVIEANTIVIRLDGVVMLPNMTFGLAAATFTGQNIGAKKIDRVHQGAKAISRLSFFVALFLCTLQVIFGKQIFGLFSKDSAIIDLAYSMMLILIPGYIAVSQSMSFGGVMYGAGDTIVPMWIALISTIFLRVPVAYLLAYLTRSAEWPYGSPYILNGSLLIAWVSGCLFSIIAYRRGRWKNKAII